MSIIISVYRICNAFFNFFKKSKKPYHSNLPKAGNQKAVCILLDKGLGDFILSAYYIEKLMDFYDKENVNAKIFVNGYNIEFIKIYCPEYLPKCICYKLPVCEKELEEYRGVFDEAIIMCRHLLPMHSELLRILSPRKIVAEGKALFGRGYSILDWNLHRQIQVIDIDDAFYPQIHRELLKKICGRDYGICIASPKKTKRIVEEDYFVVNIDARDKTKIVRYSVLAEVVERLIHRTGYKAILLGNNVKEKQIAKMNALADTSFVNRKNIEETASLCMYAKFIITPDTGILHLGVSCGNKVIVPAWSNPNALFETYPDKFKEYLCFVRKYEGCLNCHVNQNICSIRKRILKKRRLMCVDELDAEYIIMQIYAFLAM